MPLFFDGLHVGIPMAEDTSQLPVQRFRPHLEQQVCPWFLFDGLAEVVKGTHVSPDGHIIAAKEVAMAQEVSLEGLRVAGKTPHVVAEGVGFCWGPSIRKFSTGELMVAYGLNPDSGENLVNVTGISLSKDNGATLAHHCDVTGLSGRLDIALPDGTLAGPSEPYKPEPLGQWRTFVGNYGPAILNLPTGRGEEAGVRPNREVVEEVHGHFERPRWAGMC